MCGISGVFSAKKIDHSLIQRMNDTIKHRGPNDEGFALFNSDSHSVYGGDDSVYSEVGFDSKYIPSVHINFSNHDANLFIAHRRLSIIDLSMNGHQPMCDSNSSVWLSYNGEIYNYKEVRDELIALGYSFITDSDTEVFLKAFQEWGVQCQNHFVGMWAAAVYNINSKKLFLMRDRFGIKPLYYWISQDNIFHFASEIKQFTVSDSWKAKLNNTRALDYLFFNGLTDHTNETLFDGVNQVKPGSYLEVCLFKETATGFDLTEALWYQPVLKEFKGTKQDAIQQFKDLFLSSVNLHMVSDVDLGFALSGGLDSSAIVCSADKLIFSQDKTDSIVTISAVNPDERFSEHKWIDIVTSNLSNVKPVAISPTPEQMFSSFEDLIWVLDEPYQSQSAFFGNNVFKAASDNGIKVLLNGQGADEYLSCYGYFRFIRLKNLKRFSFFREVFSGKAGFISSVKNAVSFISNNIYNSSDFARPFLYKIRPAFNVTKSSLNPLFFKYYKYPYSGISFDSKLDVSNFQLYKDALPRYLRWEDRNSMSYSVEARVPFLDHRLVEFCHSLPIDYLDTAEASKFLLVESMRGIMPEPVRCRKDKKGFITPEERWFKIDFKNELRAMLEDSIYMSKGLFNDSVLERFDDMVNGKTKFDLFFWRVIVLSHWMKVYRVEVDFE